MSAEFEEKVVIKLPKNTIIALQDLAHQTGVALEDVVAEALVAHLPALEARRKILEAHIFPKDPFPKNS